jgi:hypothetical protein
MRVKMAAASNLACLQLLLPSAQRTPFKVVSAEFRRHDGDASEEGVCPPCDVKIRLKTTEEEDLHDWLREFSLSTRTDYIVDPK